MDIFSWLKKHFIPHVGNDHRPHILRGSNIRNILIFVFVLEMFAFLLPILYRLNISGGMAAVMPAVLSNLTNEERAQEHMKTLKISPVLTKAAEMKAKDMAEKGYFSHTSPEGKTPWYWLDQVGYNYEYAGENLAIDFSDSKDVTEAWMKSPSHKANIIKENYTEVGTGIAVGKFEGKETVFVAQLYANPFLKEKLDSTKNISKSVAETTSKKVLGAETINEKINEIKTEKIPEPNIVQKMIASPRSTTNMVFYFIFGMILTALLLYVFIKKEKHSYELINHGLAALVIVGAIFITNHFFSRNKMIIIESIDYSLEEVSF